MLTSGIHSLPAARFYNSTRESTFGQVFENNMPDNNSFNGNTTQQIELALSNSQYAYFYSCSDVRKTKAYENCEVKHQCMVLIISLDIR